MVHHRVDLDARSQTTVHGCVEYNFAVHKSFPPRMSKMNLSPSGPAIVAQAPCRADLAGGTIDLWPLYLFHPGAMTLNFAVNIQTTCRVTPLKGKGIYL